MFPEGREHYLDAVTAAEQKYGIPTGMYDALVYQESKYNPNKPSPAGAIGISQIVPRWHPHYTPGLDPYSDIDYGASYLRENYNKYGDWTLAQAAYNTGPGNLDKAIKKYGRENWQLGVVAETRNYVVEIANHREKFSGTGIPSEVADEATAAGMYNTAATAEPSMINSEPVGIFEQKLREISPTWAFNRAQLDSIITGDTETFNDAVKQYKQGARTVQNEVIAALEAKYTAEFIDQGVLSPENMEGKSPEEILSLVESEYQRLGNRNEEIRNLIGIEMMRKGLGNLPYSAIDDVWKELTPIQTQALLEDHREKMAKVLQAQVDSIAAAHGVDFSILSATGDVIRQDMTPFWGTITRVIGTRKFIPEGTDIGFIRSLFPGEIRQEIREWWVQATFEQKKQWLQDIEEEWARVRQGPQSALYTRYLVIENLMGIFTDDLLQNGDPDETFDRVIGNLDVALGAIFSIGIIAKSGKRIGDLFGPAKRQNLARVLAEASGARAAASQLDQVYVEVAAKYGVTIEEAALDSLPRPAPLADARVVDTDDIKHTSAPNEARTARAMEYTDEAEILLVSKEDRARVVAQELDAMDAKDTVHVHHKMSVIRPLDNDVGMEFQVVLGAGPNEGFTDFVKLMDEMEDLSPNADWRIMVKDKDGKLVEFVSAEDIRKYKERGTIPARLDELLKPDQDLVEISRFFGMRKIENVSSEELAAALENGWIPPSSRVWDLVRKELNDRAANPKVLAEARGKDTLSLIDGQELFVEVRKTVYYKPTDATATTGWYKWYNLPIIGTAFKMVGPFFAPNSKFANLYRQVSKSYRIEEAVMMELNDIAAPFFKLDAAGKQKAGHILEWIEDRAKTVHHETGTAKAPTMDEVIAQFPDASEKVLEGVAAYRTVSDVAYKLFNRRLYRDFHGRDFVTIRSATNPDAPNYHGRVMTLDGQGDLKLKEGMYFDPKTNKLVQMSKEELAGIIAEGGGFIKLDFPITNPKGVRYDQILARKGDYEIGKLSENPLAYYEGYQFRFYEDPYYLVRVHPDSKVNGVKSGKPFEEAIRTAASEGEAIRFLNRGKAHYVQGKDGLWRRAGGGAAFRIIPARDLNNTEGSLFQQQALFREGRLFWDQRSMDRLPDVSGNRAPITDPTQSLFKGLSMVSRQVSSEGMWKSFRSAFENEFKDLPIWEGQLNKLRTDKLHEVERTLDQGLNASTGDIAKRYREAKEYIKYLRSQLGTDSDILPKIRGQIVKLHRYLDQGYSKDPPHRLRVILASKMAKMGMGFDPFGRMRRIAFGAYMVLRPARQFLLQSMQVSFISPLAIKYTYSGKLFVDAHALRAGIYKLRTTGLDDGWDNAFVAKHIGLSRKEYNRMVEEFHRSGLLGSVNTHSYGSGIRNLQSQLDPNAGVVGRAAYNAKSRARAIWNGLSKGFELGEQNNLTFSWLIALRRYMDSGAAKKAGKKKLTDLTREDWDQIALDADGLALAMSRPNKFKYQSGMLGVMFQFLSFQHRAALSLLGANPAIKGADLLKLWVGNYALWGTNVVGAEDWAREYLNGMGMGHLLEAKVIGDVTLLDYLAAGMVETNINLMGRLLDEEWQNLDLSVLAPGVGTIQIYKQMYEIIAEKPFALAWLGPSGSVIDGFSKGLNIATANTMNNEFQTPGEKLIEAAAVLSRYGLPQTSDFVQAWIAYQTGEWEAKDGDKLHIQSAKNSIVARLGFGIRPADETRTYRMRAKTWETEEEVQDYVNAFRPVLKNLVKDWEVGKVSDREIYEYVSVVYNLTEDAPEGIRHEIMRQLMNVPDADGESISELLAKIAAKGGALSLINSVEAQIKAMQGVSPKDKQNMLLLLEQLKKGSEVADTGIRQQVREQLDERIR